MKSQRDIRDRVLQYRFDISQFEKLLRSCKSDDELSYLKEINRLWDKIEELLWVLDVQDILDLASEVEQLCE